MRYLFKLLILCLLAVSSFYFIPRPTFQISDVISTHAFREDWEIKNFNTSEKLDVLFDQPLTYLGEGGQSYAFASADDKYVLKFFKFNRFRPSPLIQLLPNIPPFSSHIQRHTAKRQHKLETAFAGYKLAFEQHRNESGLLIVQLNALPSPLQISIKDKNGELQTIDLQYIPFIVQLKGEMLSETLARKLENGDIASCKSTIDQLFSFFRTEHAKGLTDLDRGIMHNIGCIDNTLFHLDVGKLTYTPEIKKPENSHRELSLAATKINRWINHNFKEYAEPLHAHLQSQFTKTPWTATKKEKSLVKECENLFSSGIYIEYHRQLASFAKEHPLNTSIKNGTSQFDRQMQLLIAKIENPLEASPEKQRQFHDSFINQLRNIAGGPQFPIINENNPSKRFFKDLINWMFLQADLKDVAQSFLFQRIAPPDNDQQIYTYLTDAQSNLHSTLKVMHQKNVKQRPEDQLLAGNLPMKLINESPNGTTLIRIAQPLIGNKYIPYWLLPPTVSPEFLQYLRQQPSHLYVNLMRRHGEEGSLSETLENLSNALPNVSVISLDKDSDFYWQKGIKLSEPLNSEEFKDLFFSKMIDPQGAYFFSRNIENEKWKTQLRNIIAETHRKYFSNQASLTRHERQDFIELTYCGILDSLVDLIQPSSMNITCRQTMDRGPSTMTLWMIQKNQLSNSEIAAMMLAPPLIIHQRTAHAPRIHRLISAAKRIKVTSSFNAKAQRRGEAAIAGCRACKT